MTTQKVTVELPEPVFRRLAQIAKATRQPLEILAAQSIVSNLPPSAEDAPLEMQPELLNLQTLSSEELLTIAHAQVTSDRQKRHQALLENQHDSMSSEECQELNDLRLAADRLMLQKAYAWAILRWRGHRVPPLSELPV